MFGGRDGVRRLNDLYSMDFSKLVEDEQIITASSMWTLEDFVLKQTLGKLSLIKTS